MIRALVIFAAIALAGCTTTQPVQNPREVWCDTNAPILLPAVAVAMLSRSDKEKLAAHNIKHAEWCD